MDVLMERIKHVVVLMLENRSFDSLLGRLYPGSADFNGLSGEESNPDAQGQPVGVWNQPGTDPVTMKTPDPDPGELWTDINTQIFGTANPPAGAVADMSGFVRNYLSPTEPPEHPDGREARSVMHYFSPEQVPVLSTLAQRFAVCDQWHASAPDQTWPNRFFAHTGTANGYVNNSPVHFPYKMPTIFTRFNAHGMDQAWRVYFHDMPQSLTLADLWPHLSHFRLYGEFQRDAKNGTLPSYSFIEPRYFPDAELPNDQHPPHNVTLGEQLIADVYNQLRGGPGWSETLLVITYDEHGGIYDHVPPPAATPPGPGPTVPFNFDRYGVRVPAVLVSPYIRPHTILRAPPGGPPFDHTSIIATLRKRFSLGAPLSNRDAIAPDLGAVFNLTAPDNQGPAHLEALPYATSPAELVRAREEPPNDMQCNLARLAAHLPAPGEGQGFLSSIEAHIEDLAALAGQLVEGDKHCQTRADSLHFIKGKMADLFRNS